ncbi:hypothetical protein [Metabacillus fastidiosus]|uniref:hypothetical protein n=1 Tax=Metabacillus fastidiosus TaxID=1458 RepID=UPI002E1CB5D2|nr:hypothetical protein [Metabacillus fastidiosus]
MKSWFHKNKNLFILFGFTTLITFLFTLLEVNLILSNTADLEAYATTNEMTGSLKVVGLMGLVNVAILTFWVLLFVFIILKVIFPNKRTVKDTFFIDEFSFLKEIPNELRKGLDRK